MRSAYKSVLTIAIISLIAAACSSSKNSAVASRDQLKGTWTLSSINYEGLASSERLKLVLLDEGTEACLSGSTWVLPNNGYGSYTIGDRSGCIPGQKNIVWSYRKEGDQPFFQYKKLPGGEKAKDVTDGYKLKILSASDASMVLQSEISYQGKPIYINYAFSR